MSAVPDSIGESPLVLVNGEGQYSLWASHLAVPPGWRVAHSESSHQDCVAFIEQTWTDIRPRSLVSAAGGTDPADTASGVHTLFAQQAARTPEAAALVWRDQEISYREVNERSGKLARLLADRGIGHGDFVALCAERSPLAIISLLGILKAGAAYVPLDPEYPVERLRYVLADTGARLLLTQQTLGHLFGDHEGEILWLDREETHIDGLPIAPDAGATAGGAAYVIHTSGSTGKPKGVLVTHRSLAHHASSVNRIFGLAPGDRVLQCRSLSFDAAAEEIFPPLLHGATLVLGEDPLRQTFRALTQQVIDTKTTFLSIPTAFWHSWVLEEDCLAQLASQSSLRVVIVAGEKAERRALDTWNRCVGAGIRWCNVYGPTEGTITSTLFEPGSDWDGGDASSVPIGHPIENVQAHVLDDTMRPVAAGTVGELYIGGDGVAVGYLNKPAMTAEKFLADPFSGIPGQRLYRTGDLVRSAADGRLEFVGRRDHQIKLRGYRIELGEVELAVSDHPDIRGCVALVDETDPEDKRLVCHVVTRDGASVPGGELMAHVRRHLPWYMVPSAVHVIDAFPMTPNGKIDRTALAALRPGAAPESGHIAPRTSVEAALAAVWEEVLDQRDISVDADFFQVGGHSLLAATLISRMRSKLGVSVPARVLFASPTIEGLAAAVVQLKSEAVTHAQ
ncbi:amino acid adenylation domain-containing protein [Streptomyces sp. NPDC006463]|uniref:amino acid adenylation domain-containing protein n=1 Tax=Streptomyces sp. NPDC006463 TaxID=3364746 RepID=UPI0036AAAF61